MGLAQAHANAPAHAFTHNACGKYKINKKSVWYLKEYQNTWIRRIQFFSRKSWTLSTNACYIWTLGFPGQSTYWRLSLSWIWNWLRAHWKLSSHIRIRTNDTWTVHRNIGVSPRIWKNPNFYLVSLSHKMLFNDKNWYAWKWNMAYAIAHKQSGIKSYYYHGE